MATLKSYDIKAILGPRDLTSMDSRSHFKQVFTSSYIVLSKQGKFLRGWYFTILFLFSLENRVTLNVNCLLRGQFA